jgi:excinuclease ABC subunit A
MQFLADVHLICESCGGKRFKEEVLEVKYKEKSIADVLDMSVDEAIDFFYDEKNLAKHSAIKRCRFGYVKLGQSSDTLSVEKHKE